MISFCATVSTTVNSQSAQSHLTHCTADEFSVLNASLGRINNEKSRVEKHLVIEKNGKVLSLCADKLHEPFSKLVYRYGPIGHVELERVASTNNKFGIISRTTSPHTGEDIVFFSIGKITYYIVTATAQGSGVSLIVYDGNKKVVDLFSGNDHDSDFTQGPAEMWFDQPKSPIFRSLEPTHVF